MLSIMLATAGKYALHTIDLRRETPWEEKSQYIFYIELLSGGFPHILFTHGICLIQNSEHPIDFVKLLVFIAFFVMVVINYGLPIHIIRDLYVTLRSFVTKCTDLYKYRLATANMRARYPTATAE